jgi:hypothetical protein
MHRAPHEGIDVIHGYAVDRDDRIVDSQPCRAAGLRLTIFWAVEAALTSQYKTD